MSYEISILRAWYCEKCQEIFDSTKNICPKCGGEVKEVCPMCAKPIDTDQRYCETCKEYV